VEARSVGRKMGIERMTKLSKALPMARFFVLAASALFLSISCSAGGGNDSSAMIDDVWYTVGEEGAVPFTGSYTTGPTAIGPNTYPSFEYLKHGRQLWIQGTLHWKYGDAATTMTKVCVLPLSCKPSSQQGWPLIFIENGVGVTSQADLDSTSITLKTDGSIWIGASHEPITDAYINDAGSYLVFTL
jgi:hypothetical protein